MLYEFKMQISRFADCATVLGFAIWTLYFIAWEEKAYLVLFRVNQFFTNYRCTKEQSGGRLIRLAFERGLRSASWPLWSNNDSRLPFVKHIFDLFTIEGWRRSLPSMGWMIAAKLLDSKTASWICFWSPFDHIPSSWTNHLIIIIVYNTRPSVMEVSP